MNTIPRRYDRTIAVIGEINLDVACGLTPMAFTEIMDDRIVYTELQVRVGGTGGSFALAAKRRFSNVELIGCIGADPAGAVLETLLGTAGVSLHLVRDSVLPTRTVLLIHDTAPDGAPGVRLSIASENTPSDRLSPAVIRECESVLAACSLLLVAGYIFMREPARSACVDAVRICTEMGVMTAVDLVPHGLAQLTTLLELKPLLALASIIISELKTLRELLGEPSDHRILELADAVSSVPNFRRIWPGKWLFLRFGVGNIDQYLVVAPSGEACHGYTGYREATDRRSFGDHLTASEIAVLLSGGISAWPGERLSFANSSEPQ